MKKLNALLIILLFNMLSSEKIESANNEHCSINIFNRIFIINPKESILPLAEIIEKTTCPLIVQKSFSRILGNLEGEISSSYLKNAFKKDLHNYILSINTEKIRIYNIENLLKKTLKVPFSNYFSDTKIISNTQLISINRSDTIKINCKNCTTNGNKNIQFSIYDKKDNIIKNIWISTKLKEKTKVLKAKNNFPAFFQNNLNTLFTEDFQEVEAPEQYFSNINQLHFYKLNKIIQKNQPLKNIDLTPLILVKAGFKTKVQINQGNLYMTSSAVAKNSGHIGQIINLYNPKTKREMTGRIVDFNTVIIEL